MRSLAIFYCLSFLAQAQIDSNDRDNYEARFKARYYSWLAAIYNKPEALLSSDSRTFTDFPEFKEIVKLGEPALPVIAREIERKSDMSVFLGEAILQITKWKRSDFNTNSLQELNKMLLQRLREKRII